MLQHSGAARSGQARKAALLDLFVIKVYTLIIMIAIKMEATKVRRHFAEEMSKVAFGKQRLLIERNGKPLVAVVPMEEFALLEEYVEKLEDRLDLEAYKEAKAEMERTGEKPIPWEQFKREHGLTDDAGRKKSKRPVRRVKRTK